jgi:phosphate transport system permease protein
MHAATQDRESVMPKNRRILISRATDQLAILGLWVSGLAILAILAAFLGYVLYKGLPVLSWDFVTGMSTDTRAGGGVGPAVVQLALHSLPLHGLLHPVAVGAGIYLASMPAAVP